jgi:hypothetical protein
MRWRQIADPYLAAHRACTFVQTVNRTKTFHVNHFCPVAAKTGHARDFGDIDKIGGCD